MTETTDPQASRVLTLSTTAFTLLFAVWLMFGVLGIPIQKELGISDVQLSWLSAVAILNGSIWRLLTGVLADRYGGRVVMTLLLLAAVGPAIWTAYAQSYTELLICGFLFGLAGNSFTVGIAWNAAWFPKHRQGAALGVFGAGNVGASATKFLAPPLIAAVPAAGVLGGLLPGGWRLVPLVYAVLLLAMAAALWYWTPSEDRKPGQGRSWGDMLRPLARLSVWRFSLDYVVVFGAYVALSVTLPKYYVAVYGLELWPASLLTALYIFPASLLRPVGGWLSDLYGGAVVSVTVFVAMIVAGVLLSLPGSFLPLGVEGFTALVFVLGIGMGVGKASVYKSIAEHHPREMGAVGGLVGLLGALGGFVLPPTFAYLKGATDMPQMAFAVVTALTVASLVGLVWSEWLSVSAESPAIPAAAPEVAAAK